MISVGIHKTKYPETGGALIGDGGFVKRGGIITGANDQGVEKYGAIVQLFFCIPQCNEPDAGKKVCRPQSERNSL